MAANEEMKARFGPTRASRSVTNRSRPRVWLAVFLTLTAAAAVAESPMIVNLQMARGELEVRFKDRPVLVYTFATNQSKPYVRALYSLPGENVLRDAPPDHLHHHGLMYAVNVNGINFWEEKENAGVEKSVEVISYLTRRTESGLPQAQFIQLVHWLAPTDKTLRDSRAAALLLEQRTLTLTIDETNREVALRWDSQFQVGPNAAKVTIHGPNYDGLGLRLPESFNRVARFQNSSNQPYAGGNSQNVIVAPWTSVSGQMGGREVMIALFGHPGNARGDAAFFTMLDPFAYLSATQSLDKKPLEYSAGDKFNLSYLLAVYSENKSPEFIQRRYDRWQREQK
jgi:hypothetical protein